MFPLTSIVITRSCNPSSAVNVVETVIGPPSPDGEIGSVFSILSLNISTLFKVIGDVQRASPSVTPKFANCPVTVTKSPGSGSRD